MIEGLKVKNRDSDIVDVCVEEYGTGDIRVALYIQNIGCATQMTSFNIEDWWLVRDYIDSNISRINKEW